MPPGDPRSVSLDASYHNEHKYIWFMGFIRGLISQNDFCDIRPLMK